MTSLSRAIGPAARRIVVAHARRLSSPPARRIHGQNPDQPELGLGELQGAKFKIEPLRREGEDDTTKRARLVYQSRKRGCLESDLILSTFAAAHLASLSPELLDQYDRLLDENDWDIYYWATQKEDAGGARRTNAAVAESPASATSPANAEDQVQRKPPSGEWEQTVGNFRAAYRPVPARWRGTAILERLRAHVQSRSVDGGEGQGMGFMPSLKHY